MDVGHRSGDTSVYLGLGVDITGSVTRYSIRSRGGTVAYAGTAGTVSAAAGSVTMPAASLAAGLWEAELEVVYAGGAVQSHPSDNELVRVVVTEALG